MLEVAVIGRLTEALWLTLIVPELWKLRVSVALSVFRVHTVGICSTDGLGDGDGDGLGSDLGFDGILGFAATSGNVGVSTTSGKVSGSGSTVTGGVTGVSSVIVGVVGVVVVVVGVPFAARSATLRVTSGTLSSNTMLLMVISPEPVTSIETISMSFVNLIET